MSGHFLKLANHARTGSSVTNVGNTSEISSATCRCICRYCVVFHCVRTPQEDADFGRYLWFRNDDPSAAIVEFRMLCHLFGGISSQCCSVHAVTRTFRDAVRAGLISTEQATKITRDLYSDDLLRSFDTVQEAIHSSILA